ncbi:ferrous iron transporter B [Candidatus Woesearchaeota archaeon]|nr:ferrous iron transporter B [Candidatus Woesearchaeota archaeon]
MKILLIGNPNIGKSAIFSRLTGADVIISNYSGTTVEFKKGAMLYKGKQAEIIDVPGTYSLKPTNKAEEVAVDMLKQGDVAINVVDSTNLERNLNLTLQLMERNIPMVIALNMFDEAKHTGIRINVKRLKELLNVPVIPTVGITGEGIKKLVDSLDDAKNPKNKKCPDKERWSKVGRIVKKVQKAKHKHHTLSERLSDATIYPLTGIPAAMVILLMLFMAIRMIGEGLIAYVFNPLFGLLEPLFMRISAILGQGIMHKILIGTLIEGKIDYAQSMGLLTTGLYVPVAMILPYIFSFYLALGFLEDSGYLPRLAVLIDNVMHKIGLHGFAIVPMLLGLGCNVPGALSTRILESRREKFIAATLMSICVPCMAQMAMIFGMLGGYGIKGLGTVFLTLFIVWAVLGLILNKTISGKSPALFMEIPPYRAPYIKGLMKKLWMRTKSFITTGIPYVLLGVFIINMLYSSGIISFIGRITAPLTVNVLGLPKEAVGSLIVGFLRKDVAVGMLLPLGLTLKQLIIASVVLTMYFPCIATFAVLIKELGVRDMIKSAFVMAASTLLVGFILNLVIGF